MIIIGLGRHVYTGVCDDCRRIQRRQRQEAKPRSSRKRTISPSRRWPRRHRLMRPQRRTPGAGPRHLPKRNAPVTTRRRRPSTRAARAGVAWRRAAAARARVPCRVRARRRASARLPDARPAARRCSRHADAGRGEPAPRSRWRGSRGCCWCLAWVCGGRGRCVRSGARRRRVIRV